MESISKEFDDFMIGNSNIKNFDYFKDKAISYDWKIDDVDLFFNNLKIYAQRSKNKKSINAHQVNEFLKLIIERFDVKNYLLKDSDFFVENFLEKENGIMNNIRATFLKKVIINMNFNELFSFYYKNDNEKSLSFIAKLISLQIKKDSDNLSVVVEAMKEKDIKNKILLHKMFSFGNREVLEVINEIFWTNSNIEEKLEIIEEILITKDSIALNLDCYDSFIEKEFFNIKCLQANNNKFSSFIGASNENKMNKMLNIAVNKYNENDINKNEVVRMIYSWCNKSFLDQKKYSDCFLKFQINNPNVVKKDIFKLALYRVLLSVSKNNVEEFLLSVLSHAKEANFLNELFDAMDEKECLVHNVSCKLNGSSCKARFAKYSKPILEALMPQTKNKKMLKI